MESTGEKPLEKGVEGALAELQNLWKSRADLRRYTDGQTWEGIVRRADGLLAETGKLSRATFRRGREVMVLIPSADGFRLMCDAGSAYVTEVLGKVAYWLDRSPYRSTPAGFFRSGTSEWERS